MNLLKVAIIGAGSMARNHIRAVHSLADRAELVGVADPSVAAAESIARAFPGLDVHSSFSDLVAVKAVDVVHVCTPMELHAQLAREALDAGCHVYIEKPVTTTLEDWCEIRKVAEKKGLKICAGHQVLFEAPYLRMIELVPLIGTPVHVESYFSFRPVRTGSGRVRPLTSSEQLIDVLPHPTYLLLDLLERVNPLSPSRLTHLEISQRGTVHGTVRRGDLCGSLVVSLEARPVEHWLRLVGTRGSIHADFVRGSVQELIGPGSSGIDKALNPFRHSWQLATRTTGALVRRVRRRGAGYPGLEAIVASFYQAIQSGLPSPTSEDQIQGTVEICERVDKELTTRESWLREEEPAASSPPATVLVTGGTGFLGREVVRLLVEEGKGTRVVARRSPPPQESVRGAEYIQGDLGGDLPDGLFEGVETVIHCAAETAGSWEAHQKNSVDATRYLMTKAAEAGVKMFVHVSSVAVLDSASGALITDHTPLHPDPRALGPYVWGKWESEREARELSEELGLRLRIVRPVPLVDWSDFSPPGRLGRRIGNIYVAVGRPGEPLVVANTQSSARAVVAAASSLSELPDSMNLVPARPHSRRELIAKLRESNPEVRVLWLPRLVLHPLSWTAVLLQKALRPRRPAVRLAGAFAGLKYEPGAAAKWMEPPQGASLAGDLLPNLPEAQVGEDHHRPR